MDFPSYVPNAVRERISAMLDDDDKLDNYTWRRALADAEAKLIALEERREALPYDPAESTRLRIECAEQTAHRNAIAEEIACLERLACQPEMQSAYSRLVGALNTDAQLASFIRAAWGAQMNYGKIRQNLKDAAEMARKVADAAGTLAELLRRSERFGTYLPSEFFSVQALLKATDHPEGDRNHYMWQGMRRVVLAESEPRLEAPPGPFVAPPKIEIKSVSLEDAAPIDPADAARDMLRYAWATFPGMDRIIDTMQRAARECEPTETGAIGAAVARQKNNPKTEYLRAFGSLLRNEYRIELTREIMHAMATTATVVLNDSEIDVTYDDVRKAVDSIPA